MSAKDIFEKYEAFLRNVSISNDMNREYLRLQRSYGHNNAILGWSEEPYREVIAAIGKDCPRVSEKTIRRELSRTTEALFIKFAVSEDADPDEDADLESILPVIGVEAIKAELERLVDFLNYQVQPFTIFIPVDGIKLKFDKIVLGDAILHSRENGSLIQEIAGSGLEPKFTNTLSKPFSETDCYLAVEAEGDFEYASQDAMSRAVESVDILNFLIASCRSRLQGYRRICLLNFSALMSPPILGRTYEIVNGQSQPSYNFSEKLSSGLDYPIERKDVKKWEEGGLLDGIVKCFAFESKSNSLTWRIKQAITWYSKGLNAPNTEEQFLNLAISLESLLVRDEGIDPKVSWGSINQKLSERVAFLLSEDCDERMHIAQKVKELYGIRSKIVHQGLPTSRSNLIDLDTIVAASISALVLKRFESWDNFSDWIERHKFS